MSGEVVKQDFSMDKILTTALQIPGVKVDRKTFLATQFAKKSDILMTILEKGPIEAGCSKEELMKMARHYARRIIRRGHHGPQISANCGNGGLCLSYIERF